MSGKGEIKERANKLLGNISLEMASKEKEISKELYKIINAKDMDLIKVERLLNRIELYLLIKQKIEKSEENYDYLHNIAKQLRNQKVRSGDDIKGFPIFKVKKNDKTYYFLTRDKAQEFIKAYKLESTEIIGIEENDNEKIKELISEIKENF